MITLNILTELKLNCDINEDVSIKDKSGLRGRKNIDDHRRG